jgi:arabinan endo-1,5-alpha-L-arabinosidase
MRLACLALLVLGGCTQSATLAAGGDLSATDVPADAAIADAAVADAAIADAAIADAAIDRPADAAVAATDAGCSTRITYGDAWIHPGGHPDPFDVVAGPVTWDGRCDRDGASSFATLSNGWTPHFSGAAACTLALDTTCAASASCATRVGYGPSWLAPAGHDAFYDDVAARVWPSDLCQNAGGQSFELLSNGWAPHFAAPDSCALSFRYDQCGGLYQNPVIDGNCPDPGLLRDGNQYVLTCTSGNSAAAFPIRTSPDLVTWSERGAIFPAGKRPAWAASDFWAPEIHQVGNHYVAYYTARTGAGRLSIGAAAADSALGPFTDLGHPLLTRSDVGVIDATVFRAADGTPYLVWKVDGNAIGRPTPIFAQPLAADGLMLTGSATQLITNDLPWEGGVVEGPWVVVRDGVYWLFYSGNSYANGSYAVGVARATAPLGPYSKLGDPIVTTNAAWVGPGHGSVVDAPSGESVLVYHAWRAGHVNGPGDGRVTLLDTIRWSDRGPALPGAPSFRARPRP